MSGNVQKVAQLTQLAADAHIIREDPTLDNATKMRRLRAIGVKMNDLNGYTDSQVHAQAKRLMAAGAGDMLDGEAKSFDPDAPRRGGAVPSVKMSTEQVREAFGRIKSGGNFRAELGLKDAASSSTTDGQLPAQLAGLVPMVHEPTRILELLSSTATNAPSVEYIEHSSTTGAASTVGAGSTMPEATLNTTTMVATMRKIGVFTTLTDEVIADYGTFRDYVNVELSNLIIAAENNQLINGDGTAPDLKGLLATSGILTRTATVGEPIDTIEEAINDLRTGASFCEPDLLIMNPSDWSFTRRTKTTQGAYLLGDPGQSAVHDIWGIPVATTTQIAAGTAVLLNTALAGVVYVREGITLEMTNSAGTDFQSGLVKVRATERLALAVARPSAVLEITGIS